MKDYLVFASAFRADLSMSENNERHTEAKREVRVLSRGRTNECLGSWKEEGQDEAAKELSLASLVPESHLGDAVNLFTNQYNQDAVLVVDPNNYKATLVFQNGNTMQVGTFQKVTAEEANSKECFTYWLGEYWLAR